MIFSKNYGLSDFFARVLLAPDEAGGGGTQTGEPESATTDPEQTGSGNTESTLPDDPAELKRILEREKAEKAHILEVHNFFF